MEQLPKFSQHPSYYLGLWIIFNLLLVGMWDLYILILQPEGWRTVSAYLTDWSSRFPMGVLLVGLIIGHLIWPSDGFLKK